MTCSICGNPDRQCCKLSPSMPLDDFVKKYFGANYEDGRGYVNDEGELLPRSTAREFYADYRSSGLSLKSYIKQTTAEDMYENALRDRFQD